jgi:hypothetical protein
MWADMGVVLGLVVLVPTMGPKPFLQRGRPETNLVSPTILRSIIGQTAIVVAFQILQQLMLSNESWCVACLLACLRGGRSSGSLGLACLPVVSLSVGRSVDRSMHDAPASPCAMDHITALNAMHLLLPLPASNTTTNQPGTRGRRWTRRT